MAEIAAQAGNVEILRFLRDSGANLHRQEEACLVLAAENGHMSAVRFLLEDGANPQARDSAPLKKSSQAGHCEVAKLLVELEGDPKVLLAALTLAARASQFEVMLIFHEKGVYLASPEKKKGLLGLSLGRKESSRHAEALAQLKIQEQERSKEENERRKREEREKGGLLQKTRMEGM